MAASFLNPYDVAAELAEAPACPDGSARTGMPNARNALVRRYMR